MLLQLIIGTYKRPKTAISSFKKLIAIRDAFLAISKPFIEIHLSNIYNREEFRTKSLLSDIAFGGIFGFGTNGYKLAMIEAINHINTNAYKGV